MSTATMQAPARPARESGWPAEAGRGVNVSEAERWASVLGGGLLAAYGLWRPNLGGLALAALGGCLVYRGATGHCTLYGALNVSTGGRGSAAAIPAGAGVKVETSATINRPAAELYRFWRNFENLPRIMPHVKSVKPIGAGRSRWTAAGPLGVPMEWEAELINEKDDELIAWRSLPGAQVDTAGSVHFVRAANGAGTEVRVSLKYDPPAGKAGDAVAWLFGEDVRREIRESLRTFKQLMEAGEIPTTRGQPSGRRW